MATHRGLLPPSLGRPSSTGGLGARQVPTHTRSDTRTRCRLPTHPPSPVATHRGLLPPSLGRPSSTGGLGARQVPTHTRSDTRTRLPPATRTYSGTRTRLPPAPACHPHPPPAAAITWVSKLDRRPRGTTGSHPHPLRHPHPPATRTRLPPTRTRCRLPPSLRCPSSTGEA